MKNPAFHSLYPFNLILMNRNFFALFFCFISINLLYAQDLQGNILSFSIDNYNQGDCLFSNYTLDSINLNSEIGPTDTIKLQIKNRKVKDEISVKNFKYLELKAWLLMNESFSKQDSLVVTANINGQSQQQVFCLKEKPKSRGASTSKNDDYVTIPVFFGTDRNYNPGKDFSETFGTERDEIHYGITDVSIPRTHEKGELESPSFWKLEFEEDPKKHVMIQDIKIHSKTSFIIDLEKQIRKSDKKQSFLFVHGYNVSFEEAARRTAQISYDLYFKGVPVLYSWPSNSSFIGYTRDEANIRWSQKNMKKFLQDYITFSGAQEIYLIAHSMGNRGLTAALIEVLSENKNLKNKIKEVILAAPDIDADVFKDDLAPKMIELLDSPITLYASKNDIALEASKGVHGYPRAGDVSDGIIVLDGLETIDASVTNTSFLGHSYFAETDSVISDIFDLLKTGRRASERKNLMKEMLGSLNYWSFINTSN